MITISKKNELASKSLKDLLEMVEVKILPLDQVVKNEGQIEGLPANPRVIKDDKYKKLKKSIEENPEMLAMRELLVYPYDGAYVVIGGNMRLAAMKDLGYTEVPAKVLPEEATAEQLKAYTIKDNAGFGEWDWDMLANEWNSEQLTEWGVDVWNDPNVLPTDELDQFFAEAEQSNTETGIKIAVVIPNEEADIEKEVRALIADALKDYPNVSVK